MSSKRMPGEGKSGNCLRALFSLILRLASSEELAAEAVDSVPWAALECEIVGSGFDCGGWADVEAESVFKRVGGLDIVGGRKGREEQEEGEERDSTASQEWDD
jgi:hypothetical protein